MSAINCLKLITPPLITIGARKLLSPEKKKVLFDGDDAMFKRLTASSRLYFEYGCGESTIWVAQNTNAKIYSIDTSKEWIDFVENRIDRKDATIEWVDCGELGQWGAPINYQKRQNFLRYANAPWANHQNPDIVLIDGRFRVLCFLTTLKLSNEGTKIIFDDYTNRPHYHIVEDFISRADTFGRQCLFIVPSKKNIDTNLIDQMIDKFEYVLS
ncbi:hypothetical protein AB4Y40_36370 [Paraburkholderia sp. EG287B]|uniref:hypothetical protein n=1 Tax=Paraburkholderia sp. EG287B TaxID=3237010 RepID=UPI0034D31201